MELSARLDVGVLPEFKQLLLIKAILYVTHTRTHAHALIWVEAEYVRKVSERCRQFARVQLVAPYLGYATGPAKRLDECGLLELIRAALAITLQTRTRRYHRTEGADTPLRTHAALYWHCLSALCARYQRRMDCCVHEFSDLAAPSEWAAWGICLVARAAAARTSGHIKRMIWYTSWPGSRLMCSFMKRASSRASFLSLPVVREALMVSHRWKQVARRKKGTSSFLRRPGVGCAGADAILALVS